jgi:ribosomal protein L7/L12
VRRELAEAKRVIGEAASKPTIQPPNLDLPVFPQDKIQSIIVPILDSVAHGQTINAIKLVREATGAGLKEAKQMVEGNFLQAPKKPAAGGCGG